MKKKKDFSGKTKEWIVSVLWALAIALVIRTLLIQPYRIPSGSMIPTLKIGDQLFASKCSYSLTAPFTDKQVKKWNRPKQGEIIVFRDPQNFSDKGVFIRIISPIVWAATISRVDLDPHKDFIKRVIGTPGDEIMIKNRDVYVNGKRLDEPYKVHCFPYQPLSGYSIMDNWREPIKVPDNHYFAMGDNRDMSSDSRVWGFVPEKLIRGKALFIHWPIRRIGWLK
ncbi:MAG: signal peptidase I [bacterium]|nr:signal peptidase I [bacterium]